MERATGALKALDPAMVAGSNPAPSAKNEAMIELDKIYNEDCLEGMKRIPDASIDCIICDLPYGVLNKHSEGGQWDSIIPLEPIWEQYNRIIKDNGAIVLFSQGMFTAKLMMSNQKMWRYNLIWKKGNRVSGFLNANRMPLRNHEDICVFYKKQPTYNPEKTKGQPNHSRGNGGGKRTQRCYGDVDMFAGGDDLSGEKFPLSIINIEKEHDGKQKHPTQKPVDLIAYLIRTYTNPGDIVLDNTIGSGTTAVAALREKRHFIGFELNNNYYNIALCRINEELKEMDSRLFLELE